ncbi:uncharacterized protein FA14DRAFT_158177 [Meira miltonrushii]|uniref:Uncharacterized protein n=1 Tax=Meira miltonrushii TaxID=1280837 RepID=A0A316V7Q5_9BASI|nr:uncharacterized protein FA14DRAFT_158177 [Meira miltonrushii]PWN32243.1 hypothetical protein FA14DRAFT_158177 [Meira miltonrushii]
MLFIRLVIFLAFCVSLISASSSCLGCIFKAPKVKETKVPDHERIAHLSEQQIDLRQRNQQVARSAAQIRAHPYPHSDATIPQRNDIMNRQDSIKRINANIKALEGSKSVSFTTERGTGKRIYKTSP